MIQMNLQNRKRLIDLENELLAARVEAGTDSGGVWEGHVHTALFKMENQRRPTRILLSVMCQPGWDGVLGKNGYMHIYMAESLHCSPETSTTLFCFVFTTTFLFGYTLIQNKTFNRNSF